MSNEKLLEEIREAKKLYFDNQDYNRASIFRLIERIVEKMDTPDRLDTISSGLNSIYNNL